MVLLDIEMPKSCTKCPLLTDGLTCHITRSPVWQQGVDCKAQRLPDCPMINCNFDMEKINQAISANPIVPIEFKIIE